MVYVDMNMVRAGVVAHPSEWPFCGYNEIQDPRLRYSVIDYESLVELFDCRSMQEFKKMYRSWVEEAIEKRTCVSRQSQWTESLAVGSAAFVTDGKEKLGPRGRGRKVSYTDGCFSLREPATPYSIDFATENDALRQDNTFYWNVVP